MRDECSGKLHGEYEDLHEDGAVNSDGDASPDVLQKVGGVFKAIHANIATLMAPRSSWSSGASLPMMSAAPPHSQSHAAITGCRQNPRQNAYSTAGRFPRSRARYGRCPGRQKPGRLPAFWKNTHSGGFVGASALRAVSSAIAAFALPVAVVRRRRRLIVKLFSTVFVGKPTC